jgi:Tfp pilus assembly ATPase PilU
MTWDKKQDLLEYLLENNAVTLFGLDEYAEPTYRFNLPVLKEIMPDMYNVLMEELDQDLLHLYQMGLVDIDYNENLEAKFAVSEKGKLYMQTGKLEDTNDD